MNEILGNLKTLIIDLERLQRTHNAEVKQFQRDIESLEIEVTDLKRDLVHKYEKLEKTINFYEGNFGILTNMDTVTQMKYKAIGEVFANLTYLETVELLKKL